MYKFNKIIELLELQNKNQKELTTYIGVTEAVFSQWKSGKSKSYEKKIDKIAEFFEVDVSVFFEQKNSPLQMSNKAQKAAELFEKLSDKDKEFFIKMLQERVK